MGHAPQNSPLNSAYADHYQHVCKFKFTSMSAVARCTLVHFWPKYNWKRIFCIKRCQCRKTRSIDLFIRYSNSGMAVLWMRQLAVKSSCFPLLSFGCSIVHVGGVSFLKCKWFAHIYTVNKNTRFAHIICWYDICVGCATSSWTSCNLIFIWQSATVHVQCTQILGSLESTSLGLDKFSVTGLQLWNSSALVRRYLLNEWLSWKLQCMY